MLRIDYPIDNLHRVNQMTVKNAEPFLRWAGSKRKLLKVLRPHWQPSHARYIEPFMGSACLFFALNPDIAILSDINCELVETFNTVRNHPALISAALSNLPLGKTAYYAIRRENPVGLTQIERAARFIYLNRFCFNGLYRTDTSGRFNVPYAPCRTGHLPSLEQLEVVARRLINANLVCDDFEDVLLQNARKDDFVYLDPPFAISHKRMFRQYHPKSFGIADLERFTAVLHELDSRGASFLVSYADCPEAEVLSEGWSVKQVYTTRNISGFARHRGKAIELLISNT